MSVKKILALLLAAMMVFGMTSALADVTTITYDTKDIPITKTLYFINDQGANVYEPNITYTYTVRGATAEEIATASATDYAGATVDIKPGVTAAFTTNSVSLKYSSDHAIVANVGDKDSAVGVTKKNNFVFDPNQLGSTEGVLVPGVYRYIITENTDETAVNAKGITRDSGYQNTLVLDVFVTKDGEAVPKIINPDPTTDPSKPTDNEGKDPDKDETGKTTGFGDGEDPTDPDTPAPTDPDDPTNGQTTKTTSAVDMDEVSVPVDRYITYNFEVSKTVTGNMGDISNNFPFDIAITNSIEGAAYTYSADIAKTADVTYDDNTKTTISSSHLTPGLKHDEKVLFKGVPSSTTANLSATITETNNTTDIYTTTAKQDSTDIPFASVTGTGSQLKDESKTAVVSQNGTVVTSAQSVKNGSENVFAFTNDLNDVSPTGVVLRFAPYFAMFAAGCVLFLILATKRSKKEEE